MALSKARKFSAESAEAKGSAGKLKAEELKKEKLARTESPTNKI